MTTAIRNWTYEEPISFRWQLGFRGPGLPALVHDAMPSPKIPPDPHYKHSRTTLRSILRSLPRPPLTLSLQNRPDVRPQQLPYVAGSRLIPQPRSIRLPRHCARISRHDDQPAVRVRTHTRPLREVLHGAFEELLFLERRHTFPQRRHDAVVQLCAPFRARSAVQISKKNYNDTRTPFSSVALTGIGSKTFVRSVSSMSSYDTRPAFRTCPIPILSSTMLLNIAS
jgi:hypothetical protein